LHETIIVKKAESHNSDHTQSYLVSDQIYTAFCYSLYKMGH